MSRKIQVWSKYGPRIALGSPMTQDEIIENVITVTNQSKGSVLAVLSELDVQIEQGLRSGRIVRLPNGMRFEPIGKKDGSIDINVWVSSDLNNNVNHGFRGKWINAENIGKTEAQMIDLWNRENPEDPVTLD